MNNQSRTGHMRKIDFVEALVSRIGNVPVYRRWFVWVAAVPSGHPLHFDRAVLHKCRSFVGSMVLAINESRDKDRGAGFGFYFADLRHYVLCGV
jgi:hypothetical protein